MNKIQEKIFLIYLEIKKICEEHGLRYWAIGGTCLGAVRHQGFIPWDIDMDIAMPDIDYNKFLTIAAEALSQTKYIVCSRPDGCMITRVHDSETTAINPTQLRHPEWYIGVHVDIMPFSGMPAHNFARKLYAFQKGLFHSLDVRMMRNVRDEVTIKGKIVNFLLSPAKLIMPEDYFFHKWIKGIKKYKYDESNFTCFLWANHKQAPKLIMKTEWFNDWIELPFESSTIRCPRNYDLYLKTQYGDYMRLPPEASRGKEYKGWFIDLNRSYQYYQESGVPKL